MKNVLLCFVLIIPFILSSQCDVDGLVIDALLLDPNGANNFDTDQDGTAETGDEFVQICNTTGSPIDLSGYSVGDDEGLTTLSGTLAGGECLTIVNAYNPGPLPPNFFDGSFALSNGGEPIALQRNDGSLGCVVATGSVSCPSTAFPSFVCEEWPDAEGIVTAGGELNPAITPMDLGGSALPVNLVSFNGSVIETNKTKLKWTTSLEINNEYFNIERSSDKVSFSPIGRVAGNGTTFEEQDYSFVDRSPTAGVNYYRLAQFDFNGEMEYHKIIAVENRISKTTIFPTLADAELAIKSEGRFNAQVINQIGVLVSNFNFEDNHIMNVQDLAPGVYFLKVESNGHIETHRFIKK